MKTRAVNRIRTNKMMIW